ncbi:hypothetical protein [Methyloversatilis thermotolerans]|uniref:hypothetical protein n=1 Tax=Methyloversatilis thermotolerans TaxID=1346290 RepID=UPI00037D6217|nr:hypothetical protein [Methyloversatilis thermotolerans]
MRVLLRAVAFGVALSFAGLALLAWALLSTHPAVGEVSPQADVAAREQALRHLAQIDPRKSARSRPIRLGSQDVQAMLAWASQRFGHADTRTAARMDRDILIITLAHPLGGSFWLNGELEMVSRAGMLDMDRLSIGTLDLPRAAADALISAIGPALLARTGLTLDPLALAEARKAVRIERGQMLIDHSRGRIAARDGLRMLFPPGEVERVAAYYAELHGAVIALSNARARRQDTLLVPMQKLFALAVKRGGDLRNEQRSALLVLALHVTGRSPASLFPEAESWLPVPPRPLTLRGREDMAQHLVGSALIAAHAGTAWADTIGLSKEVRDARSGSGFSFTDLMADRAGTRLGERIAAGDARVARVLAQLSDAGQLLPELDGLAEFMPEAEFRRRFGGVGTPAYQAVMTDIDARIGALEIYQ